jgi:hypothetical protein
MVISMVDVGEETGQLPEMLLKIADVYEDEVDNSVSALTSMLEPLMIVMLALVVGVIVMALFLPSSRSFKVSAPVATMLTSANTPPQLIPIALLNSTAEPIAPAVRKCSTKLSAAMAPMPSNSPPAVDAAPMAGSMMTKHPT